MSNLAALLPRSFKPWVWEKLSSMMHLEYRLPSGICAKIASYSDWCIYNDIFVAGEYDSAIEAALERATSGGTLRVVDLGANVGFFTLRVCDLIDRRKISLSGVDCLLVEASPRLESAIRMHLNSVKQRGLNAQVIIGLVGKKHGDAQLELRASSCMNQVVEQSVGKTRRVAYYDLDKAFNDRAPIDLLKCDIEGSERDFLESYSHLLLKTRVAVFEFHSPHCPAAFGISEVMKAGFTANRVLYEQGRAQTVCFER